MKEKFSTEDLIHSLPDYITNKISDLNLKLEIEKELESNSDFRREYGELRNTFGFLNSSDLDSPSESYFNNLSVKINDRINNTGHYGNFWQRMSLAWKILIPAIPVIIIAILLFGNLREENMISQAPEIEKNKTELTDIEIKSNGNKEEVASTVPGTKPDESKSPSNEMNQDENAAVIIKKGNKKNMTRHSSDQSLGVSLDNNLNEGSEELTAEENVSSNDLSDNIEILYEDAYENEEDVLFSDDNIEGEILENEFINLPPEEQQEIINNLNNAQI